MAHESLTETGFKLKRISLCQYKLKMLLCLKDSKVLATLEAFSCFFS